MSPDNGPSEVIAGVLDTLRQSRNLLLDPSPRNIDRCRMALSQCIHKVACLMQGDRSEWNPHELRETLLGIRSELSAIAKLLDSAAVYRRGVLSVISAANRPPAIDLDPGTDQTVRSVHVLG